MSKDRFAPKYGNMVVSNKYQHDDLIEKELREMGARTAAMMKAAPQWKKEMWADNRVKKGRLTRAQRTEREKLGREAAEARMIEAVRTAVGLLEHHMVELGQNPRFATKAVNQMGIHNVIVTLRNKCGVKFETNPEYAERVSMDRTHLATQDYNPKVDAEFEELRKRQREQREAATQRVIDRLKARPKQV